MEQQYEVVTLSNSPKSCGSTTAAAEDKVQVSGVTMPATALAVAVTGSRPMATQSRLSQAVTTASAHRTRRAPTSVAAAPGDGWAPIYFRYGAFIPEDKVWAGGLTGSFGRPFKMFHGDGRGYDPNGSTRYRFTAKATFGSTHSIEITKNVGQTIAYGCTTPWGTDCVAIQSATAPDSELSWINVSSGNTTADFTLVAAAKNPLVSIAPPIDAGVAFHLRPGGTTVRGIHDRMPVHEIYFYVEGWGEWEPVYRSDAWFLPCLGGYAVAPGCETKFSVLL